MTQPEENPFRVGDRVAHATIGHGTVVEVTSSGGTIVKFDNGKHGHFRVDFLAPSEVPAPANDNEARLDRLKILQRRYGGEIHTAGAAIGTRLYGSTVNGEKVTIGIGDDGQAFTHTLKEGRKPLAETPAIRATPFHLRDPASLRERDWLFAHHYIRRYLTATVGPGGGGKSAHAISEVLAMVTGRPLLDPDGALTKPLRVWYINAEDPQDEIDRRFHAAAKHFGVTADQMGDRLFADSGREQEFVIMRQEGRDFKVCQPLIDEMVTEIALRQVDVVIVDPFVSTHEVPENDNGAMQRVAKAWLQVAEKGNCCIEVVHHVVKNGGPVTADSARGGGALKDKTRGMRVLNAMTDAEAAKCGLDSADGYFRIDSGKVNLIASGRSQWRRFASVALGNGTGLLKTGDQIGVVEAWRWPSADDLAERAASAREAIVADVPADVLAGLKVRLEHSDYKADQRARNWAGNIVAELCDLDPKVDRDRIKDMLSAWVEAGELSVVRMKDASRHEADFIKPCGG